MIKSLNQIILLKNGEVLRIYDGKIYGWNNYLLIFDFIEEQKKKLMKIGGGDYKLCLINDNNLILCNNNKIILIDIEEFKIIGEIKDIPSIENKR